MISFAQKVQTEYQHSTLQADFRIGVASIVLMASLLCQTGTEAAPRAKIDPASAQPSTRAQAATRAQAYTPERAVDRNPSASTRVSAGVCNGAPELCGRRYDQVSYPTTHNAFNYAYGPQQYLFPNQQWPLTRQLEDGVRALMLDVHEYNGFNSAHDGEIWVCHSVCWAGGEPLIDVLGEIRAFLDKNPSEVVTIIFENYVEAPAVVSAFDWSGLTPYAFAQPKGAEWPTLGQLIDQNKRLVVFTDSYGGSPSWLMPVWDYAVETHYANEHPSDMTCAYNRGNPANSLFIFNHFLTYPLGARRLAYQVNYNPFLVDRARQCQTETGKLPNFVTLDFYDMGDLMETVDQLNGL